MPQTYCQSCNSEFYAKPSWIRNGGGKYCSASCRQEAQKNGSTFKCHMCNKKIYRTIKAQLSSKSKKYFCTKSCQTVWRNSEVHIGHNHPSWITGQSSYRERLLRSNRQKNCARCLTTDVRILSVHHKDKNRDNNNLSNLMFMCHNCHFLVHNHPEETEGYIVT